MRLQIEADLLEEIIEQVAKLLSWFALLLSVDGVVQAWSQAFELTSVESRASDLTEDKNEKDQAIQTGASMPDSAPVAAFLTAPPCSIHFGPQLEVVVHIPCRHLEAILQYGALYGALFELDFWLDNYTYNVPTFSSAFIAQRMGHVHRYLVRHLYRHVC